MNKYSSIPKDLTSIYGLFKLKTCKGNLLTREYNTKNVLANPRHYPVSNKEWKDSAYAYNKNYLRALPFKNNNTDKLIKSHFNLSDLIKTARSRRMRTLLRRGLSKRLFVSKPEIKQNNDKVTATVYVFDRIRQSIIRNLFFNNRKFPLYNLWLNNLFQKRVGFKDLILKRKNTFKKARYTKRIHLPYNGIKFKNEIDFFKYRTLNIYNKFMILDKVIMYLFVSNILSKFNIKIFNPMVRYSQDYNIQTSIQSILDNKPDSLILVDYKLNKLNLVTKKDINEQLLTDMANNNKGYETNRPFIWNNHLLYLIKIKLVDTGIISKDELHFMYKKFNSSYYNTLVDKELKKESKAIYLFTRLQVNKLKYIDFLPNLKKLISRIYYKKTELNIVSLKYIHLNSDLYAKAIADKSKAKVSLLKVLRKSLKLVKRPSDFLFWKKKTSLNIFGNYKSLDLNDLPKDLVKQKQGFVFKDSLENVIHQLYPNPLTHDSSKIKTTNSLENKVIDILNTVKYKWVTGARIEAAGRLTRRNTAARAVFKFRYKGNLKDRQPHETFLAKKDISTVILRNHVKPNSQYTFTKSKRRIGAFGIKTWISSH